MAMVVAEDRYRQPPSPLHLPTPNSGTEREFRSVSQLSDGGYARVMRRRLASLGLCTSKARILRPICTR
jgi:hypothetical protein